MKLRIINKNGKYIPQQKFLGFWLNFYGGYSECLEEFDGIREADKFIRDYINNYKIRRISSKVIKEYVI